MHPIFRFSLVCSLALLLLASSSARAVPILQLYVEGGVYNESTESWEITPVGSSAGAPFRIWAIGNVDGPGGQGTIHDVRLSMAFDAEYLGLEVVLTPTLIGGGGSYNGFIDAGLSLSAIDNTAPSLMINTSLGSYTVGANGVVDNGSSPVLSDGRALAPHGVFGDGVVWKEYGLGDFDQTTDTIGDFIGDFPTEVTHNAGQINAYDVQVFNGSGATIHIDLYDNIEANNRLRAVFAPFSHNAEAGIDAHIAPEPGALFVWSALLGLGLVAGRLRQRRSAKAASPCNAK